MFVLTERLGVLGEKYSGSKNEKFTFEVVSMPMDEIETNEFFGHPSAYRRLHCYVKRNKDYDAPDAIKLEPFLPGIKSIEIEKPVVGACIQLRYGLSNDRVINFRDCTLSKITIPLGEDGETGIGFKVTAPPVLNETLSELIALFGKAVLIEVRSYPPDAQKDLPLNRHGEGEQSESTDGKKDSKRRTH